MTDIRTSALKTPVDVAEYLFTRLHQIGVRSVHGVPGDYNLVALDYIEKTGLKWVGNVNELNAGKSFLIYHLESRAPTGTRDMTLHLRYGCI
jgi:pyruvate decarboxylase